MDAYVADHFDAMVVVFMDVLFDSGIECLSMF